MTTSHPVDLDESFSPSTPFEQRPSPLSAIRAVEAELAKEPPPAKPTDTYPERVKIMLEGAALTNGQRDAAYGTPQFNMSASAALKIVFWTFADLSSRTINAAEREALDMVLTKLGRIATGPSVHRDNYIDGSTYLAIAGESAQLPDHPALEILKGKF